MTLRVIIAVRGGAQAKSRLAGRFGANDRAALVEAMLADMLETTAACPFVDRTYVVTPTHALARIAARLGSIVMLEPEPAGMNQALEAARRRLAVLEPDGLIGLLPGDLPYLKPRELVEAAAAASKGVVIIPSLSDGGTGAIFQPAPLDLPLVFGPDSFRRHCGGGVEMGLPITSPLLSGFGLDLDHPSDVERLANSAVRGRTADLARRLCASQGAAA